MRSWRPTWPRRRPRSQHDQGQVSGRAHEGGAHATREPQLPSPGHAVPHNKLLPDGLEELLQQLEVGDTCRRRFWTCDQKKRDLKKRGAVLEKHDLGHAGCDLGLVTGDVVRGI